MRIFEIFEIFDGLGRPHLIGTSGQVIQMFPPELTELQRVLLDLLGIPEDRYRRLMGDVKPTSDVRKEIHSNLLSQRMSTGIWD
jgi:hypothetical protein